MNKKQIKIEETINLIHQAIRSCGADFATLNVRSNLLAALREASHVSKKRDKRERSAMEEAAAKATNLHKAWWDQIEENVRKYVKDEANLEKAYTKEKQPETNTYSHDDI